MIRTGPTPFTQASRRPAQRFAQPDHRSGVPEQADRTPDQRSRDLAQAFGQATHASGDGDHRYWARITFRKKPRTRQTCQISASDLPLMSWPLNKMQQRRRRST